MAYQDHRYTIKVVSQDSFDGASEDGVIESGCLVRVFDAGTRTESTIYSDKERTSKTNAITRSQFATDGGIEFYSSASSHDIAVYHSSGSYYKFEGVTPNTRTVKLPTTSALKCLVAEFGSDTSETDLSVDFPLGALITDAFIEVTAIDATEDIDVGLLSTESGGDADGLLDGISVATLGFVRGVTFTAGGNDTYLSASTYGTLLGQVGVGTDVANDVGEMAIIGHVVTAAVSLSYTASAGSDTGTGYIYCPFKAAI